MVLGIDVFHDASRKSGSIAGLVSTTNQSLSRYYSTAVFQMQVSCGTASVLRHRGFLKKNAKSRLAPNYRS